MIFVVNSFYILSKEQEQVFLWSLILHNPIDNFNWMFLRCDRRGGVTQSTTTIYGVIQSFVSVEEYKKKGNLELYEEIFEKPFLTSTGRKYCIF